VESIPLSFLTSSWNKFQFSSLNKSLLGSKKHLAGLDRNWKPGKSWNNKTGTFVIERHRHLSIHFSEGSEFSSMNPHLLSFHVKKITRLSMWLFLSHPREVRNVTVRSWLFSEMPWLSSSCEPKTRSTLWIKSHLDGNLLRHFWQQNKLSNHFRQKENLDSCWHFLYPGYCRSSAISRCFVTRGLR